MSDGHGFDFASLSRASTDLATVARAIAAGLSQLNSALSGPSGLGTDEISGPFAREYGPISTQAIQAIGTYQQQVSYASQGLARTAAVAQQLDTADTGAMDQLRAQWQPVPPSGD